MWLTVGPAAAAMVLLEVTLDCTEDDVCDGPKKG
jgi:hypothetical protein